MSVDPTLDVGTGLLGDDEPNIEQIITLLRDYIRGDMRVALPCVVVSSTATRVRVQVPLALPYRDGGAQAPPLLASVPILYPGGGGGFSDTYPLAAGAIVWVMFSDQSIREIVARGADATAPITPKDTRRFTLNGAVALPVRLSPGNDPAAPEVSANTRQINLPAGGKFAVDNSASELIGDIDDSVKQLQALIPELQTYWAAVVAAVVAASPPVTPVPSPATNLAALAAISAAATAALGNVAPILAQLAIIEARIAAFRRP